EFRRVLFRSTDVSIRYRPHIHYKRISIFNTDRMKDMRTSIINKIVKAVIVVQLIVMATSCKDYLNIDEYFDDEFNIDEAFNNIRNMEAYMWWAAAEFNDEAQTIRSNYKPEPKSTDEPFNGLTGAETNNVYYKMVFATGNITPTKIGGRKQWGNSCFYTRQC